MVQYLRPLARQTWLGYVTRAYTTDSAGSVRAAGGSFSKKEQAQEDQYFHNLEAQQIEKLKEEAKEHHEEEISHHQEAIKDLEEQIQRHKAKIDRHQKKIESH